MSEHPWTPGPWRVEHVNDVEGDDWYWIEAEDGDTPIYGGHEHEHSPRIAANLELTALAPEMAEAILALDDAWRNTASRKAPAIGHAENAIAKAADTLRAIGT